MGGDYIGRNYDAAATEGRIVQIAFLKGGKAEVDFRRLMVKRLHHTGSTLRPRSWRRRRRSPIPCARRSCRCSQKGACKPIIDSTFKRKMSPRRNARMDSSAHIGKIVLTHGGLTMAD